MALIEGIAFCCAPLLALRLLSDAHTATWPLALLFTASMMMGLLSMGLYCARQRAQFDRIVLRVLIASFSTFFVLHAISSFHMMISVNPAPLLVMTLIGFVASVIARFVMEQMGDESFFKRRVLVLGSDGGASQISQLRRRADRRGFTIVGFVPVEDGDSGVFSDRVFRRTEPLLSLCRKLNVNEIVVAMEDRRRVFPAQDLLECRLSGYEVVELSSFLERETGKVPIEVVNPSWMIFAKGFNRSSLRHVTERVFDFVVGLLLGVVTWPLFLLIGIAIKIESGRDAPVFYLQPRVGFGGRIFNVVKFRSMRIDAENDGVPRWATKSDPRITRVGTVLRKLRLDELPQIINVLFGEMRFVGPRPERPHFVNLLSHQVPYYRERHFVKPGITGWAQLCYKYGASERDAMEKLQYDLYYIKHHSLLFDLSILIQTVEVIFLGKGAR